MNATRVRSQASTDPDPYGTPGGASAPAGHDFTLQTIMDLKGSVGELKECVRSVQSTLDRIEERLGKADDKLDARLDKLEVKVSGITTKLYAAWIVTGILVVVGGWLFKEAWDIAKPVIVQKLTAPPGTK